MVNIVSLVENRTSCGCRTAHGLSLYVETPRHRLLFDVGGDDTLFENAERLGVDLREVDIVVISHGHRDHGGALRQFMELNAEATIYIQRGAFDSHFSRRRSGMADIGLDRGVMCDGRVVLLDGECEIDEELTLFKVADSSICASGANASLYEGESPDRFEHEQNLIIKGETPVLIMGCGHNGVVNIMERAREFEPEVCVGGFHLTSPSAGRDEPRELIDSIIERLRDFERVSFYTCHCTGEAVYEYMSSKMDNIEYLSCGDRLVVREQ